MSNIIDAIINLIKDPVIELSNEYIISNNRANSMGAALEEYIKDLFANTKDIVNVQDRMLILNDVFSYLGNQNNPPDMILKYGDAIEVKKIEGDFSSLALNSSYPKAKIYSSSNLINESCRICETKTEYTTEDGLRKSKEGDYWDVKDIIYIVGVVKNNNLSSLTFVYGEDFAADNEVYEKIKDRIKIGVETIPDVEFYETKELGRVNRVDPLGITYLRIRGMWGIENPFRVFNYIYERDKIAKFNFMGLINKTKWNSFENRDKLIELIKDNDNASISDVFIKNPNNPAKLKEAVLITYKF